MTVEKQIPVGTMCAMFGLNPNTVRTWERRYAFPSPGRSSGGHRTYSETDIELIGRIVSLIKGGTNPGEAVLQARTAPPERATAKKKSSAHPPYYDKITAAVATHDQAHLRRLTSEALKQMEYQPFIEELAFPLLNQLGHAWETSGEGVAAEHSFSMLVEAVLLQESQRIRDSTTAPVVTFACVPDEMHQMPVLHLANLAAASGTTRPLVLAAGLPLLEILKASELAGAKFILLSATIPPSSADTREWMKQCLEAGWAEKIILAGPGFMRSRVYADYPVKAAAGSFTQTLDYIKAMLKPAN